MKKLITLFVYFCISAMVAYAEDTDFETLQFVNADNEVVESGATMVFTDAVTDDFGTTKMATGLKVLNNTDKTVYSNIVYTISTLDGGEFEVCYPTNCTMQNKIGTFESTIGEVEASKTVSTQSAWMPETENYGKCKVKMQIKIYKKNALTGKYSLKANGPEVTCEFVYADPTGIGSVKGNLTQKTAFNLMGQPVGADYKGVVVVDGKKMLRK